jgi:hypothetical protein
MIYFFIAINNHFNFGKSDSKINCFFAVNWQGGGTFTPEILQPWPELCHC